MLDDFADVLRILARGDEQRIVSLDHNQVLHSDGCNELAFGVNEISLRIQGEALLRVDHVFAIRLAGTAMLIERGPGAKIIPSEARRDAIDARLAFTFRRARL